MLRSMPGPAPLLAFLAALPEAARPTFADAATRAAVTALLEQHLRAGRDAYPEVTVAADRFAAELARRMGEAVSPEQLDRLRADHVYLAIACADGDDAAIRRLDADFLGEVEVCAARLRALPDQAAEARAHLRRILFNLLRFNFHVALICIHQLFLRF